MRVLFIFILFVILSSCNNSTKYINPNEFSSYLYSNWISTNEILQIRDDIILKNDYIKTPSNSWSSILKNSYFINSNLEKRYDCLLYKTPLGKATELAKTIDKFKEVKAQDLDEIIRDLGELKIIKSWEMEDCSNNYFKNEGIALKNIVDLKIVFADNEIHFTIHWFDLELQSILSKKISIQLMNLTEGNFFLALGKKRMPVSVEKKKFKSSVPKTKLPGVLFIAPQIGKITTVNSSGKFNKKSVESPDLKYSLGKLQKCHEVNDSCETTMKYQCDKCRWGWFETISSKCSKGGTKFCGINSCGERGEPACIRGNYLANRMRKSGCIQNSRSGFCAKGLTTYCDSDGILVCL